MGHNLYIFLKLTSPIDSIRLRDAVIAVATCPVDSLTTAPGMSFLDISPCDVVRTYRLRGPQRTVDRWAAVLRRRVNSLSLGSKSHNTVILKGATVADATSSAQAVTTRPVPYTTNAVVTRNVDGTDGSVGGSDHHFDMSGMQVLAQEDDLRVNARLIEERAEAMSKMQSDMEDIHDMFVTTAQIVREQGAMLDSIEANLTEAEIRVEAGVEELVKARRY